MNRNREQDPPTLRAVIAYAAKLRVTAAHVRASDPYAEPYDPSEDVARRCYYTHLNAAKKRDEDHMAGLEPDMLAIVEEAQKNEAASSALQSLAGRALAREKEKKQDDATSERSLKRHQRRQREASRDREQSRQGLSIGQRLDRALARFSSVSSVGAAEVGWSTPSSEGSGLPSYHGDSSGEARQIALRAVRDIEALLDGHLVRDVEKAA